MNRRAATPILSADDNRTVALAVGKAEARADGEIVTVVSHAADSYGDVALGWSALVALLALLAFNLLPFPLLGLLENVLRLWAHRWTTHDLLALALLTVVIPFAVTWLALRWQPLRLRLTPGPIKAARVRARANLAFRLAAQGRTRGATGVVIYLSLAEHRAEIVADHAIAAKVAPEVWGDAMHAMLGDIRAGRIAAGLAAGVDQVGQVLAAHFPRDDKPANELPNGPIEL